MKKIVSVLLFSALVAGLAGCGSGDAQEAVFSASAKPVIAVTIVPEQTFVEAVCGQLAEVVSLVPPGNSPANYEPTAEEMQKLSEASIYFSIGVPTEDANILPNAGDIKVVALNEAVAAEYAERTFESGERDPHIWLSPKRVEVMIETIASEMCALDPSNAQIYNDNAAAYISLLEELDAEISAELENLQNRKFIVYHPAFGYFADDYGLTMYALEEDGKEATARHLQEMIDLAESENIRVVFYQDEIASSQAAAFAEEIDGAAAELSPLSADYIENLRSMALLIAEMMQ